ncbi:MAG: dihydroneopterin aldolase [Trueperella sp.]|nr:dihydroneopterin aldolase [Trueperella sp.]
MAVIELTGLEAQGTHGVLDFEHAEPQLFRVDIALDVDTAAAAAADDLGYTVDYGKVAEQAVAVIQGEHCDLIETLAHRILAAVLSPAVESARVTVHKPNAPIPATFQDVAVTVSSPGPLRQPGRREVVIAVGANLGDPVANVSLALRDLSFALGETATSSLYRSPAMLLPGQAAQPDYINAVAVVQTELPPLAVLEYLQEMEQDAGRIRTEKWGARPLDLDIVQISGVTSTVPKLLLPHPGAASRRFVLEPWLEADPNAELAGTPVRELLAQVADQELEKVADFDYAQWATAGAELASGQA